MTTSNVTIRMDSDLKKQGEKLFNALGFNMTTAINSFVRQAVREQAMPFTPSLYYQDEKPTKEMLAAFSEIENMKNNPEKYKGYISAEEMSKDILG